MKVEDRVSDPETGLIYLRARYYDPSTAQFLTRDPLDAMTRSAYGYAGNDPLNQDDPSGLCFGWDNSPCPGASTLRHVVNKTISVATGGHADCVLGATCGKGATSASGTCIVGVNCTNPDAQSYAKSTGWGRAVQVGGTYVLAAALACALACPIALAGIAEAGLGTFAAGAGFGCVAGTAAAWSERSKELPQNANGTQWAIYIGHLAVNHCLIGGLALGCAATTGITFPWG